MGVTYRFVFPIKAIPKGRPRLGRGRVFTPLKTRQFENEIAFLANHGWDYLRMLNTLKEINANSPVERIRNATAVDEAIRHYSQ